MTVFRISSLNRIVPDVETSIAISVVSQLQRAISRRAHIPEDRQILLISGGQSLDPKARVCSYYAGTDTNPIFLFNQEFIDSEDSPVPITQYSSSIDSDLKEQVEGSMNMPATFETVVSRVQLALQFHDVSKEELHQCENLVHDQHLQHQGWAAVIANLEDITSLLKNQSTKLQQAFERHQSSLDNSMALLTSFPETINVLGKTPILACLIEGASIVHPLPSDGECYSLLDWITEQDRDTNLDQLVEQCQIAIEQFGSMRQQELEAEVVKVLQAVDNPEMKEVKGLEDRLQGLELLINSAKKIVQEQAAIAQGMAKNQDRARYLRDVSVLPDLCNSHKTQLTVLFKNQQKLSAIKKKIAIAKDELGGTLLKGLRWVSYIESQILRVHGNLAICYDRLQKIVRQISIMKKMNDAPAIYARAVVETVRRRSFRSSFMKWSSELVESSQKLYDIEVKKREAVIEMLRHHFLKILFPGFDDMPPAFATKMPRSFDHHLPSIEADDVKYLLQKVPELAHLLQVSFDASPITTVSIERQISSHYQSTNISSDLVPSQTDKSLCGKVTTVHEIAVDQCSEKLDVEQCSEKLVVEQHTEKLDVEQHAEKLDDVAKLNVCLKDETEYCTTVYSSLGKCDTYVEKNYLESKLNLCETCANSDCPKSGSIPADFVTADFALRSLQELSTATGKCDNAFLIEMQMLRKTNENFREALCNMKSRTIGTINSLRKEYADIKKTLQLEGLLMQQLVEKEVQNVIALSNKLTYAVESKEQQRLTELSDKFSATIESQRVEINKANFVSKHLQEDLDSLRLSHRQEIDRITRECEEKLAAERERCDSELKSLRTNLMLENELEVDKIKEEMNALLKEKEDELELCKSGGNKRTSQKEIDFAVEQKVTQLQSEKEQIVKIMREEFQQEQQKLICKHNDELKLLKEEKEAATMNAKEKELIDLRQVCDTMQSRLDESNRRIETLLLQINEGTKLHAEEGNEHQDAFQSCKNNPDHITSTISSFSNIPRVIHPHAADATNEVTAVNDLTLGKSVMLESVTHLQYSQLQSSIREKEEELVRLRKQVDELQMSASTTAPQQHDKVSVTTCNAGDIILLCLDEKRNQYLVFNVTEVLHFLHSDCIETLGLKSGPGEVRKAWVLAEVVDKEYCQAKKANNRFGVPVHTRFYRVKAKPWKRVPDSQQKT